MHWSHSLASLLTAALLTTTLAVTARAAAPELSKNVRVYRAQEGVSIAVAQFLPSTEAKAALRVSGTDTALDDVVLLATVDDQGDRGSTLKITWRGRSWGILTSREGWWGGNSLELHVPEQKSRSLYYDEKESKKVTSTSLAGGLERDKAKAAAIAGFDRAREQSKHEQTLQKASDKVQAACGSAVTMSVDWPSIDDETLKSSHIASFCGAPLESLASLCKEPQRAALVRQKIQKASCRFGGSLKLAVEGGALSWQTSKEARNQGEFAKANLMNLLQ
ncbi:MAG: hypothetical protein RL033_6327 [Pseudomonadota bacterium]|jgi:hypothetical protein